MEHAVDLGKKNVNSGNSLAQKDQLPLKEKRIWPDYDLIKTDHSFRPRQWHPFA